MSFHNIPNEVLEHIFSFLDGRSFSKCCEVCKRWSDVQRDMLMVQDWWKVFCFREIPVVTLRELCGSNCALKTSVHDVECKSVDWRLIYQQWFTCRRTASKKFLVSLKNYDDCDETAPVTCCKVSGSWILTGHRNGYICAWDLNDGNLIRIVTQHVRMVTDFVIVDLLKAGLYQSSFHESPCGHHCTVSVSKDHTIHVSSLLKASYGLYFESHVIRKHSSSLESVKLFRDRFVVLCADNTLSVWSIQPDKLPCEIPKVTLICCITGPEEQAGWISFWNNKIGCFCKRLVYREFDLMSGCWSSRPEIPCIEESEDLLISDNSLVISSAHLFWNSAIFLMTADHHLLVSTCKSTYMLFPTMERFHSYVMCLCFCGPLLAMGFENGLLVLFYIKNPPESVKEGLRNPVWQKRLSPESIIAVDIMLQANGPLIVAATAHSWTTVSWSRIDTT